MTNTRDIRLTHAEIRACEISLRDEVTRRTRSIDKAEASRAAGNKVQHGTLEEHYAMRDAARSALEAMRVADRALRGYGA